jgi:drug/metabolite transporter (DMT)-like permease
MKYKKNLSAICAIIAGLSFGSIPVISAILRDLHISSIEQTFLRIAFGGLFGFILLSLFWIQNRTILKQSLTLQLQKGYIFQGIIFVLMILAYLNSIALNVPVGEAVLLVQIHPFITLLLGRIFLKEEFTYRKIVSVALAITGLVLLTEPWKWESFLSTLTGNFFALLNGLIYACYILVGRARSRERTEIPFSLSISWVLAWSLIVAVPLLLPLSFLPILPSISSFSIAAILKPDIIIIGLIFAVFGSIIPYSLIMIASNYIESSKTSILLLGEPIGAIIFGAILLGEPITIWYLIGGLFIISAVIITVIARQSNVAQEYKEI